jgi:hypothetical protein
MAKIKEQQYKEAISLLDDELGYYPNVSLLIMTVSL